MKTLIRTIGLCATLLSHGTPSAAQDLERTLGLDRRVGFLVTRPDLAPFTRGVPIETVSLPDALMIPLQAANEGLAFYAAYRDRNVPAMAAVGAMSLWGGTLRRGIDAVTKSDRSLSLEDLADLSEREIAILGYLWGTDGRSGSELYARFAGAGTWEDLSDELAGMTKRKLIRKTGSGSRAVYEAEVTPADTRRAAIASGQPERINAVLLALKRVSDSESEEEEANLGSSEAGDGFEAK